MIKRFLKFTALVEITPEQGKWVGRSPVLKLTAVGQSPEEVMKDVERQLKEAGADKQGRDVVQYSDLKKARDEEKRLRHIGNQEPGVKGAVSQAVAEPSPVEVPALEVPLPVVEEDIVYKPKKKKVVADEPVQ
jgi:hypothetical protein